MNYRALAFVLHMLKWAWVMFSWKFYQMHGFEVRIIVSYLAVFAMLEVAANFYYFGRGK